MRNIFKKSFVSNFQLKIQMWSTSWWSLTFEKKSYRTSLKVTKRKEVTSYKSFSNVTWQVDAANIFSKYEMAFPALLFFLWSRLEIFFVPPPCSINLICLYWGKKMIYESLNQNKIITNTSFLKQNVILFLVRNNIFKPFFCIKRKILIWDKYPLSMQQRVVVLGLKRALTFGLE